MRYAVLGKRMFTVAFTVLLCAGVLLLYEATRAVRMVAAPQKQLPIYSVETDKKEVSLGINCAWDNEDIPQLLDILDEYQVKASFFVVGDWCDKFPDSVRQIASRGHEVGSHSDTHPDMTKLNRQDMQREIRDSAEKIEALTGKKPDLFRPPSGAYNAAVIETIRQEGFYPIQWDCDSLDYKNLTPDEMQARIFKKLRKGSILLFHSGAKNTPAALRQIIAAIQAEGYRLVPVSELIYKGEYTVSFEGRQSRKKN